ncbi:MAG: Peptidase M56 BlaR1 [Clostridium butyricum DORA_1]|nr:MAG: Peptidase M56 BlaR1 [Clostridium butyricum DORA_1]MDU4800261.1 M56 family metallopeptidase [Clostridium butyricum]
MEYIFLHELLHIKKNHILVNYIIFTLSTIHWFNPIIRYSLNKIKEDMEIICDSEVLNILDYNKKLQYGNLLLDLQEISTRAPWLPQMAGIINNKNKLKRRLVICQDKF